MGKIKKQGLSNTFWNYVGIAAGAIYTIFIVPKTFSDHPEYWGLIQFLVYYMQVLLPLAQLGLPNVIIRFHPKIHPSELPRFYFFIMVAVVTMTSITSILVVLFGDQLGTSSNPELYNKFYNLLVPLIVGASIFETFSAFSRAFLHTRLPVFLKEAFSKIWTLLILILFTFNLFSFATFIVLYSLVYILQLIIMAFRVFSMPQFNIHGSLAFFLSPQAKQMYPYMLFTTLGTSTAIWATKIDVLMIGYLAGYDQVAFYTIALYIATLLVIPFRSMSSIAVPMIADFWSKKDLPSIQTLYQKISETSLVSGSYIFLIIWFNIDWLMDILGPKFGNTHWVFFFLAIAKLVDVTSSINGAIIITSRYYKMDLIFQSVLIVLTIGLNLWLIPVYKLEGAAVATLISLTLYNLLKVIFLRHKVNIIPWSYRTAWIVLIFLVLAIGKNALPISGHIANATLSAIILTAVYAVIILRTRLAPALKNEVLKTWKYL